MQYILSRREDAQLPPCTSRLAVRLTLVGSCSLLILIVVLARFQVPQRVRVEELVASPPAAHLRSSEVLLLSLQGQVVDRSVLDLCPPKEYGVSLSRDSEIVGRCTALISASADGARAGEQLCAADGLGTRKSTGGAVTIDVSLDSCDQRAAAILHAIDQGELSVEVREVSLLGLLVRSFLRN